MTNVFDTEYCIVCFIKFCVPAGFTNQRRKDCAAFYCPTGHRMAYNKTDTEESRLPILKEASSHCEGASAATGDLQMTATPENPHG